MGFQIISNKKSTNNYTKKMKYKFRKLKYYQYFCMKFFAQEDK